MHRFSQIDRLSTFLFLNLYNNKYFVINKFLIDKVYKSTNSVSSKMKASQQS